MRRILAFAATMLIGVAVAGAATGQEGAGHWRALAKADADAALTLVADNHPGAAPQLGDVAFQGRLALARRHVAERLPLVTDYAGYAALMQGIATDFRDGHIWARPLTQRTSIAWTGIVPVYRGGRWMVGAQRREGDDPDLAGARILSCDGVPIDAWAKQRIGLFGGDPAVGAVLVARAPTLLVDGGNPFVKRPARCVMQPAGQAERTVTLHWRETSPDQWRSVAIGAMRSTTAGMGISRFPGGYWIALSTLETPARALVEQVRAQQDALRQAPMVVVDLRGNGGGNSDYARQLAIALVGKDRVDAAGPSMPQCNGAYWRATPGNVAGLRAFQAKVAAGGDADFAASIGRDADALAKAVAAGRAFEPQLPPCSRDVPQRMEARDGPLPPSRMRGRLIVVTDYRCFSSCLMAVDLLRRLRAEQVGEATNRSTRYMEVREVTLPSGLMAFSTLQKVVVGLGDFGPYTPDVVYSGAMADSDALKQWVAALPPGKSESVQGDWQ